MTLNDFVSRWNGKYIDTDNAYGGQCMDEMHQWCLEGFGIQDLSVLAAPCAKDVWNTFPTIKGHELFEQIPNTPTGVPQEGDIMLWTSGTYGHVATFVEGNVDSFRSFDQNYPTGTPCHIQNHTYTGVAGWFRCKSTNIQKQLDECRVERDRNWNWYVGLCEILGKGTNFEVAKAELQKLVGLEDKYIKTDSQLKESLTQIEELKTQLDSTTGELEEIAVANNSLVSNVADMQKRIADATNLNTFLSKSLEDLRKQITTPVYQGWKKALVNLINRL